MVGWASLRPVTGAELAVLPWRERPQALAATGWRPSPILQLVRDGADAAAAFADPDLVLALACDDGRGRRSVVGSVVVSERARYLTTPHALAGTAAQIERLMVIDRLWIAKGMSDWQPPLRCLLLAAAAMTIATVGHDGSARTCVACRADRSDEAGSLAISAIGAGPPEVGAGLAPGTMWPGVHTIDDLRFLDAAAAAAAARIVLGHLDGSTTPARTTAVRGPHGAEVEGMLSLSFPRALKALREEIALIADGSTRIDWRRPAIAMNDLDAHLRRTARAHWS